MADLVCLFSVGLIFDLHTLVRFGEKACRRCWDVVLEEHPGPEKVPFYTSFSSRIVSKQRKNDCSEEETAELWELEVVVNVLFEQNPNKKTTAKFTQLQCAARRASDSQKNKTNPVLSFVQKAEEQRRIKEMKSWIQKCKMHSCCGLVCQNGWRRNTEYLWLNEKSSFMCKTVFFVLMLDERSVMIDKSALNPDVAISLEQFVINQSAHQRQTRTQNNCFNWTFSTDRILLFCNQFALNFPAVFRLAVKTYGGYWWKCEDNCSRPEALVLCIACQ